jgi:ferritin-like metal-binding protein YciE
MKLFSANIEDLRSLYLDNLQKALDMEEKIAKALPTLIEKSNDPRLAEAFRNHLLETEGHVMKVETLLRQATDDVSTVTCKAIGALTAEASDVIKDVTDPSVRDIAIIGAAQQVEHHEIAVYGTLRTWAELLDLEDDADVLESILREEKNADELLSDLSDTINTTAETEKVTTAR